MEYQKIKGKRHYVYDDMEEFKEDHPNITVGNWRDANEGDWVWSDDDRIVQLLKVSGIKHPNDRKNYKLSKGYVRTIVGTFLNNKKILAIILGAFFGPLSYYAGVSVG